MILAGGAVAVVACSSSSGNPAYGPPSFCCNANGDPCCEYKYCGGPLTAECTAKMGCEAEGGTWSYLSPPDCVFGSDAGTDAPPDNEPSDAGGG